MHAIQSSAGSVSLFEVHTCYDIERSENRPAHECRSYALTAAPTNLKFFFDAGAAAGFFMIMLLFLEILLVYFTTSFHLGYANWAVQGFGCCCRCALGLSDKTFLIICNGIVSFLFMLTFSIYAGVVNKHSTPEALNIISDSRDPSTHNYGGGFALVIINWMLHAGIAVALHYFVEGHPLDEPVVSNQPANGAHPGMPPTGSPAVVQSGAAAEFVGASDGTRDAEQGAAPSDAARTSGAELSSGVGDYAAPLTEPTTGDSSSAAEAGGGASSKDVGISIGEDGDGDDEEDDRDNDDEWNSEPTGGQDL